MQPSPADAATKLLIACGFQQVVKGHTWTASDIVLHQLQTILEQSPKGDPSKQTLNSADMILILLFFIIFFYKKYNLLIILLQLSYFSPLYSCRLAHHLPPAFPHLSSCPWVVHIHSLASPFPILFLTSPCLFCPYHLCFLFPVSFPPFPSLPLPIDNPPFDLHVILFLF